MMRAQAIDLDPPHTGTAHTGVKPGIDSKGGERGESMSSVGKGDDRPTAWDTDSDKGHCMQEPYFAAPDEVVAFYKVHIYGSVVSGCGVVGGGSSDWLVD